MTPVPAGLDRVALRVQAILDRFGGMRDPLPRTEGGEFAFLLRSEQGDQVAPAPQGKLRELVIRAAHEVGVDPDLVMAVLLCESGGDPRAVSPAGAAGLMQLMPQTARELGVTDVFDPVQNLKAGASYLRAKLGGFGGDLPSGRSGA